MIKKYPGSLYGTDRTKTFAETWKDSTEFINDYNEIGIPTTIDISHISTLYYLLYSRYGNSRIASSDPTRFKYNLFSIIWQYAPNWVKKLDIQEKLRNLSDEDILQGARHIYNNAQNPSTDPSNFTDSELQFINAQSVSKTKKGKLDGYAILMSLLKDDVTEIFLGKFKALFKTFNMPELPLIYETGEEEYD